MSVTLMMVSHFAQKVRCEPSPPDILPITELIMDFGHNRLHICVRSGTVSQLVLCQLAF